jgi:hypothetical protein
VASPRVRFSIRTVADHEAGVTVIRVTPKTSAPPSVKLLPLDPVHAQRLRCGGRSRERRESTTARRVTPAS